MHVILAGSLIQEVRTQHREKGIFLNWLHCLLVVLFINYHLLSVPVH